MMYQGHRDQKWGPTTYSQHGEDLLLLNLFSHLGIEKPSYLDVGAHHPINISNTKLLYDRGSRGVNVEANPDLIEEFKKERPEDINLCVGIDIVEDVANFYMYDQTSGRNTLSLEETQRLKQTMQVRTVSQVHVTTMANIVKEYCKDQYPTLLTMDIEGMDFQVLSHTDFSKSAPVVVVVETRVEDTVKMRHMMQGKGFYLYCRSGENLIFIHRYFFQKAY